MIKLTYFWMQNYLKQGRVVGVLIIAFALFFINAVIYDIRYREDLLTKAARDERLRDNYESIATPDDLAGTGFSLTMPSSALRFIIDNNLEEIPTARNVSHLTAGLPYNPSFYRRQTMELWDIDQAFLVNTIFSFLAIVLCFDAACGEREQGTLKLLLAYGAQRHRIVVSKVLASVAALGFPLVAGMLISSLYLTLNGSLAIGAEVLAMELLFLVLSLLLITFYSSLSLLVSSLTRHSITSLVMLLLIWILLVVVVPGLAKPLAKELSPVPTQEEYARKMNEILEEFMNGFDRLNASDRAAEMARADDFKGERVWNEMRRAYTNSRQGIIDEQLRSQLNQIDLARNLANLTPNMVFNLAVSKITGNDLTEVKNFFSQVGAYRSVLFSFLESADSGDSASPHLLYSDGRGYLSTEPLHGDIPVFTFRPFSLDERLFQALPDVLFLFASTAAVLALAVFAFARYDVR